jgi:flagellar biogenesis protein FliO
VWRRRRPNDEMKPPSSLALATPQPPAARHSRFRGGRPGRAVLGTQRGIWALCAGIAMTGSAWAQPAQAQAPAALSWSSIVGTLVALLFVLALAWGGLHVLKRLQLGRGPIAGQGPQLLRSVSVGPRERLVVVRHHDQEMLLGVTAASIVLLDKRTLKTDLPAQTGSEPRL